MTYEEAFEKCKLLERRVDELEKRVYELEKMIEVLNKLIEFCKQHLYYGGY